MDSLPLERHAENPLAAWDKVQRMSEPWYITKAAVVCFGMAFAMVLAYLAATGQFGVLLLVAVWVVACVVIIFVRDYWWAPALIITALSVNTYAAGFRMTGLEVGIVILGLTFPVKLAMKTLWPAKPKLEPGTIYWLLFLYVVIHAIVIYFYSKIDGAPQIKNIIKAYYGAIAPLVLYGMLIRYCDSKTVFRTCVILFWINICTTLAALAIGLTGVGVTQLMDPKISVEFADPENAFGFLRGTGPFLFISVIAFWPAARTNATRWLLTFSGLLGLVATLYGSGRTAVGSCLVAAVFFAAVRGRLWLAFPMIMVVAATAAVCTAEPEWVYYLPDTVQRSLEPLNFSDQKTEVQKSVEASDDWHNDLRSDSLVYWNQDTTSFFLGHGFKGWDDSLLSGSNRNADIDTFRQYAVEMGLTENMFSAITNIFGLAGLVLYGAFFIELGRRLWKARMLCPERSPERAICDYCVVNLATSILMVAMEGRVPGIGLVYWALGLLAARPYIGITESVSPLPAPAFDRSRQVQPAPSTELRGDLLAAFAKRQARVRISRTGSSGI